MDLTEIKKCVDEDLPYLLWALGLEDRQVSILYEPLNGDKAQANMNYCHSRLKIKIDPYDADLTNRSVLRDWLRHELLHYVSEDYVVFLEASCSLVVNQPAKDSLKLLWDKAAEKTTEQIETLLDRLGLAADRMIELAKSRSGQWLSEKLKPRSSRTMIDP